MARSTVLLFVAAALAVAIGVSRYRVAQTVRSRTAGQRTFACSPHNTTSAYTFTKLSKETNGEYFEFEERVAVGARTPCTFALAPADRICTPLYHFHDDQRETFKVLQGVFEYQIDGVVHSATAADAELTIGPGVPHNFWAGNSSSTDLVVRIRVYPASAHGVDEAFFETLCGLFRDAPGSGTADAQLPPLLNLMMLLDRANTFPAGPPPFVAKAIVKTLAFVGSIAGYQLEYPEYNAPW